MKILLAVTGSISAYRSLDICRNLTKDGHEVIVLLSKGAEEFVKKNAFHYLGASKVYSNSDDFNIDVYTEKQNVLHIELVKWCDRFVIAPLSANTLAKLAHGFCDDLISSVYLALGGKPCLVFPAMNTQMLNHPRTIENLNKVQSVPNTLVYPSDEGELACGDIGAGKLPKPEHISEIIPLIHFEKPLKNVLITTGATISPLDPVRYITNPSSGITGYELAKAFIQNGYAVTLVYGNNTVSQIQYLKNIPNLEIIETKTTMEMLSIVDKKFPKCDVYVSSAAICDILFEMQDGKLKKSSLNQALEFKQAPDILKTMIEKKSKQFIIGFAAETDTSQAVFLEKWNRKKVDLLIGNLVNFGNNQKVIGFGQNQNKYYFIKDGDIIDSAELSKKELALKIVKEIP